MDEFGADPSWKDKYVDRFGWAIVADLVRLHVLGKYGGVWLDYTIVLQKPLHDILAAPPKASFAGFYLSNKPHIENWLLWAVNSDGQRWMRVWKEAMIELLECDDSVAPCDEAHLCGDLTYYVAYRAFCTLLQNNPAFENAVAVSSLGNADKLSDPHRTTWRWITSGKQPLMKLTRFGRQRPLPAQHLTAVCVGGLLLLAVVCFFLHRKF